MKRLLIVKAVSRPRTRMLRYYAITVWSRIINDRLIDLRKNGVSEFIEFWVIWGCSEQRVRPSDSPPAKKEAKETEIHLAVFYPDGVPGSRARSAMPVSRARQPNSLRRPLTWSQMRPQRKWGSFSTCWTILRLHDLRQRHGKAASTQPAKAIHCSRSWRKKWRSRTATGIVLRCRNWFMSHRNVATHLAVRRRPPIVYIVEKVARRPKTVNVGEFRCSVRSHYVGSSVSVYVNQPRKKTINEGEVR